MQGSSKSQDNTRVKTSQIITVLFKTKQNKYNPKITTENWELRVQEHPQLVGVGYNGTPPSSPTTSLRFVLSPVYWEITNRGSSFRTPKYKLPLSTSIYRIKR